HLLKLHRRLRPPVALLADGPRPHELWDVELRRDFAHGVDVFAGSRCVSHRACLLPRQRTMTPSAALRNVNARERGKASPQRILRRTRRKFPGSVHTSQMSERFQHPPDPPWSFRTYAGHSTPTESNKLYRANLARGQTGLSVAFDLPTQTGYDSDHVLARGEVGRVGVPVGNLGDMRALFDGIPLERTNTSMTINATAMWLLTLYQVVAEEQGADIAKLTGTTQNDIIKEYLSRGTYIFP